MKDHVKKLLTGLTGASLLLSGCAPAQQTQDESLAPTEQVESVAVSNQDEAQQADELVLTTAQQEDFVRVSNVTGEFGFDQDVLSPTDDIFNIFGTALTGLCAKPSFAVAADDADETADYYVNVHGSMRYGYSVNLSGMKDKEQTKIMACACATGNTVVNAAVTGVAISDILEIADLQEGANTIKAVGADGYGIALPLSYALEKEAMIVYQVNGENLPDNQRTQLWMPGTVAKYFTRNVVDLEITAEEEVPEVMTADADHRAHVAIMNYFDESVLPVGEVVTFEGYADDYDKAIAAIEFSLDGGEHWTSYAVENATADKWVYWHFSYTPQEEGTYQLTVRAVSEDGTVSPLLSSLVFRAEHAK